MIRVAAMAGVVFGIGLLVGCSGSVLGCGPDVPAPEGTFDATVRLDFDGAVADVSNPTVTIVGDLLTVQYANAAGQTFEAVYHIDNP